MASGDRFSYIEMQVLLPKMSSVKTGGLCWQWPVQTGFTVFLDRLQNSVLRKWKFRFKVRNSVEDSQNMQILHSKTAVVLYVNRLPRILWPENGNSALNKWKFHTQKRKFCAQKMGNFLNAMESQVFCNFSALNWVIQCCRAQVEIPC